MAISMVKAIINGTSYTLSLNEDTGAYETTLTAPSKSSFNQNNGFYDVSVTAYDDSGNTTTVNSSDSIFGDLLKLYVRENNAPVIEVVNPSSGAMITNNRPTITWKCSDDDSGVKKDTIKLFIDEKEVNGTINATFVDNIYTCSYIPEDVIEDGIHTLKFYCEDNDGNFKESSVSITIDTVPPTLNVLSPSNELKTNKSIVVVSGITNDLTSSPVKVMVNDKAIVVNGDGNFSTEYFLEEGENTINIVAIDGAGKSTTVVRKVYYDSKPPVIGNISIIPNPVDAGKTFVISVSVTD